MANQNDMSHAFWFSKFRISGCIKWGKIIKYSTVWVFKNLAVNRINKSIFFHNKKISFSFRAAAPVSGVSRLRRSRARALLSLNLKKKRDCSQSRKCMAFLPGRKKVAVRRGSTVVRYLQRSWNQLCSRDTLQWYILSMEEGFQYLFPCVHCPGSWSHHTMQTCHSRVLVPDKDPRSPHLLRS